MALTNDYTSYSATEPGNRTLRTLAKKPFEPSGPFGCRITVNLGPFSSNEMVRNLLIRRSGLAWPSLQQKTIYYQYARKSKPTTHYKGLSLPPHTNLFL